MGSVALPPRAGACRLSGDSAGAIPNPPPAHAGGYEMVAASVVEYHALIAPRTFGHWSLVIGHWPLVIRHSSFVSGVSFEPDLYRCAITVAGVFDWAATIKSSKYFQHEDPEYARLLRKLGDPSKQAEKFESISPIHHVKNVRVPVFVSHGGDDRVVEITESKRLTSQLEKHNVPHETYFVGDEGHGMGKIKHRVELYRRIEAFLAKHVPAQK